MPIGLESVEAFEASLDANADPDITDHGGRPPQAPQNTSQPSLADDAFAARFVGRRLGHFRIMRTIGSGSMGMVFQVEDLRLSRIAAMKVLRRHLNDDEAMRRRVDRFLLEARVAASIEHPAIARIYEIGDHRGWWYIAMELLEGGDLRTLRQAGGPIAPDRLLLMAADAARGLAAAHDAGVIHRDIKPGNLMLSRAGRCKIVDFGLVKLDSAQNPFGWDDGKVVGTPLYVAPEVALRKGATPASDVYSLGATLYHLVAGEPPYASSRIEDILKMHARSPVPDLRDRVPGYPAAVASIIAAAMAKQPEDRPPAAALAARLQAEVVALAGSLHASEPASQAPASWGSSAGSGVNHSADISPLTPREKLFTGLRGLLLLLVLMAAVGVAVVSTVARRSVDPITPSDTPPKGLQSLAGNRQSQPDPALSNPNPDPALSDPNPAPNPGAISPLNPSAPSPRLPAIDNSIGMRLEWIPPGSFTMGSPADEPGRNQDERATPVRITTPFYIAATEITQRQWAALMGSSYAPPQGVHPNEASGLRFLGDDLPVYVSWDEAQRFCQRLSALENRLYRLPTEAEWEYACRAGSDSPFAFGPHLSPRDANVEQTGPEAPRPAPVASSRPNPWGLYDMHGNVWEWCQDTYAGYPLGPLTDPLAHGATADDPNAPHVLRGGAWESPPRAARSANRWWNAPVIRTDSIGFRVVLVPGRPPQQAPTPRYPKTAGANPTPTNTPTAADPLQAPSLPDAASPIFEATPRPTTAVDMALPAYAPSRPVAHRFRVVGSDTMDRLARRWEQRFLDFHPTADFRHDGRGSDTAIPALLEGVADIGPISRPLTLDERRAFLSERGYEPTLLRVATDVLAVFVHPSNPVAAKGLTIPELASLFADPVRTHWAGLDLPPPWAQIPIRPFGRNNASGTHAVFLELALNGSPFRPDVTELVGSSSVIDAVAADRAAIAYSSLGYASSAVAVVPIRADANAGPVLPTPDAVESGLYPLARPLFIAIDLPPGRPPSGPVAEFLRFLLSRDGQDNAADSGFLPLTAHAAEAQLRPLLARPSAQDRAPAP